MAFGSIVIDRITIGAVIIVVTATVVGGYIVAIITEDIITEDHTTAGFILDAVGNKI